MPLNRSTLIRLTTIDRCLQNHYRQWTLDDLIEACSEKLTEFEGRNRAISRRTIQGDIQLMRSEKLGYNAPIVVRDKKFYAYDDPDYSITRLPLSDEEVSTLTSAMDVLRHFQIFPQLSEASDIISKLEDHISVAVNEAPRAIDLERNERLKGLELIPVFYHAIQHRLPLVVVYQSFNARKPSDLLVSPYLLKEFRNRWFLLCSKNGHPEKVINLAIDRVKSVRPNPDSHFMRNPNFDAAHFFDNVLGVTKSLDDEAQEVVLRFNSNSAPYVLTKPLHSSQKLLQTLPDHSVEVSLQVVVNFELEREIIAHAETCEVLSPPSLRQAVARRLRFASLLYELAPSPAQN